MPQVCSLYLTVTAILGPALPCTTNNTHAKWKVNKMECLHPTYSDLWTSLPTLYSPLSIHFDWSFPLLLFWWYTNVGHLRHHGDIGLTGEDGRVVVDVLHSDDELGGGLQGSAGLSVSRRGDEAVLVLLLAVQRLGDVYVARVAVNHKTRSPPPLPPACTWCGRLRCPCPCAAGGQKHTESKNTESISVMPSGRMLMQVSLVNAHPFVWQAPRKIWLCKMDDLW